MVVLLKNQPGYNETLLLQTNSACPELLVITEFNCTVNTIYCKYYIQYHVIQVVYKVGQELVKKGHILGPKCA